jgi:hypothetical protein
MGSGFRRKNVIKIKKRSENTERFFVIRIGFKPMTYCLAYQLRLSPLPQ